MSLTNINCRTSEIGTVISNKISKRLVTVTACLDRMHSDKVNWIHCFPRVNNNPGSIFGSNNIPVGSPALCTYYGESQSVVGKHNLEIMKDN